MDKEAFLKQYETYSAEDLRLIRDTQQDRYTAEEMTLIESLIERQHEQEKTESKRYTGFYILSFLIPLAGVIAGIIYLRSPQQEMHKVGRQCLITGMISLLLWSFFWFGGFRI